MANVESVKDLEVAELNEETTESTTEVTEEGLELTDSKETKEESKTKQSKEDNSVARNARLQAETRYKEQLAKETKKAYEKGLKEAETKSYIGRVNPYTQQTIQDEVDIEEYKEMLSLVDEGKDPIKDYGERVKQKARANLSKNKEAKVKQQEKDKQIQDFNEFTQKYPDVDLKVMFEDKKFQKFINGKIGNQPLTEIYEDYNELIGNIDVQAEDKAKKILANKNASPGALNSVTDDGTVDFDNMSDEDFEKYEKAVSNGQIRFKK